MSGRKSIQQVIDKAVQVIAVLALHGNKSDEDAKRAFRAGCESLEVDANTTMPQVDNWADVLDNTLAALDRLRPADKSKLVKALIATVMADNRVAVAEMELLRVVCSVIHVPLPMISGGEPDADI